jgi:hypothetical protein
MTEPLKNTNVWTGVGSRRAPDSIRPVFVDIARRFAADGWTLRSGGADGPDTWCEAETFEPLREVYRPHDVCDRALQIAASVHPAWNRCDEHARRLHARNVYQILGRTLDTPSRVLVCWTPDGEPIGGTATAIRLAERYEVETINLGWSWMTDERALFLIGQIIAETA